MADRVPHRGRQLKGLSITVVGVVILSPDGLLTTMIALDDWALIFWRGLLLAGALLVITTALHGRRTATIVRAIGWPGIGVGVLFAMGTIFFVLAVRLTTIANALFLLAVAPLFGAIFSRVFLGERIPGRTYATTGVVLAGMAIIFGGELEGSNLFWGNAAALAVAACGGGFFVLLRKGQMPDPAPAFALGGLLAAGVGLALAPAGLAVPRGEIVPLAILSLFVLPVSFAMVGRGPRYLPAPEVNLIMLLEAVLGPLWGVLIIAQMPPGSTLVGGAVVLAALAVHFGIGLAGEKDAARKN